MYELLANDPTASAAPLATVCGEALWTFGAGFDLILDAFLVHDLVEPDEGDLGSEAVCSDLSTTGAALLLLSCEAEEDDEPDDLDDDDEGDDLWEACFFLLDDDFFGAGLTSF